MAEMDLIDICYIIYGIKTQISRGYNMSNKQVKKTSTKTMTLPRPEKEVVSNTKTTKLPKETKYDLKESDIEKLATDYRTREIRLEEKENELRRLSRNNSVVTESLDLVDNFKKTRLEELKEVYKNNKALMEEKFREREQELARREKHEKTAEEQVAIARAEVKRAVAQKDIEVAKTKSALDQLVTQVNKIKNDLFILTAEVDSKDAEFTILRDARRSNSNVAIDAAERSLTQLKHQQSEMNINLTEKNGQMRFAQDKYEWTIKEFENRVRDKENILTLALDTLSEIRKHADLESSIDIIAHDKESAEIIPMVIQRSERVKNVIEKPIGDDHKTVSIVLDDRFIKTKQSASVANVVLDAPQSAYSEEGIHKGNQSIKVISQEDTNTNLSKASTSLKVMSALLVLVVIGLIVAVVLGFTVYNWF